MRYVTPAVLDFGSLKDITEAVVRFGPEDGASKLDTVNHHSLPATP